jgi:hypothetical protein
VKTATLRHIDTGCDISSFYDEDFLRDLKAEVSHFARSWNKTRKLWIIEETYVPVALEIAKRYFRGVELNRRAEQHQHTHSEQHYRSDNVHAVLHLLPTAPSELVKAAYRALSMLYHPDRGGDVQKMQALYAAYEKITK